MWQKMPGKKEKLIVDQNERAQAPFNKFRSVGRQSVRLSQEALVKTGYLEGLESFPLLVQPNMDNVNLVTWASSNKDFIEAQLLKHGAILFRDFAGDSAKRFEQFARTISPELLDYSERAAPRKEVGSKVYTSTEYPADQRIPLHHEMSYSHNWPTKIWFYCQLPAQQRGGTPIARDRAVFKLISPEIKERFVRKKVMYVRNYGEGVDLSWQEAFQTEDRAAVEAYCRQAHTDFEWRGGNRLRTRQVRQAVATHPKTGETFWFNHAHMFHISNVEPSVRDSLLSEFKEDELPRNAFYGDGTPIESSVLEEVREVYRQAAITFAWQQGDILMLDNFLVSHGRESFVGPRRILVAMAELYVNQEL
jgi:alpha-ketoglutarate-dependent taurine dioxygenase